MTLSTLPVSTVALALAWFAAVNVAASVLCAAASRALSGRIGASPRRVRLLVALRLLPTAVSTLVAVGLFVPAHVLLEPESVSERLGPLGLALASGAIWLLVRSAWRAGRIAVASAQLRAALGDGPGDAGADRPVITPLLRGIALAGVVRPRILVGAAAGQALTRAELEVALAHERAHRHSHDNLIRVVMRCAPDVLGTTAAGRRLEALWEAEAECVADARAAAGSDARATCLASALVKVARLAPAVNHAQAAAWSTFHQPALLETRVRLLVGPQGAACGHARWRPIVLAVAAMFAAAWTGGLPARLHDLTEILINF